MGWFPCTRVYTLLEVPLTHETHDSTIRLDTGASRAPAGLGDPRAEFPQGAFVWVSTRRSPGCGPGSFGAGAAGNGSRTAPGAQPHAPRRRFRTRAPERPPPATPATPPGRSGPGGSAAPYRTYLDLLACCVVGRGHATRRRAATSPRAASVATHRPPPARGCRRCLSLAQRSCGAALDSSTSGPHSVSPANTPGGSHITCSPLLS